MSHPFFSVIIPTYNRARFIATAITSVITQEFENWELVIVDDGSTDNTKEVVESFQDLRIKYIYQPNRERSAARNNGIKNALGTYICFLDSDDYYLKNHLKVLHDYILSKEMPVAMFYTGAIIKSDDNERKLPIYEGLEHPVQFIFYKYLRPNSVAIHKNILTKHKFIEEQTVWEDINLFLRIALKYPFWQIKEYTTVGVTHEESGGKKYFSNPDIPQLKQYINNINHVFKNSTLSTYVSDKERRKMIKSKIVGVAYIAAWKGHPKDYLFCLKKMVSVFPEVIFEKQLYKSMKELLYYSFKKNE